ncbi:MAG TPA: hypothetical protein VFD70_20630, partial [Anaerolineae bacterium]|nr:hypothetical protein [Anaerolineae bacterium]
MNKAILVLMGVLVVGLGIVFFATREDHRLFADCQFRPSSLVGKSMSEIESAALNYTCANFKSNGVAARVRLSRLISPKEYMSFFGATEALCDDQELALVIFEGDFDDI